MAKTFMSMTDLHQQVDLPFLPTCWDSIYSTPPIQW